MDLQVVGSKISKSGQLPMLSSLKKALGLKNNDRVIWNIDPVTKTAKLKPAPKDWGKYMSGLGKHVWEGVDVEKYIKEGRKDRTF